MSLVRSGVVAAATLAVALLAGAPATTAVETVAGAATADATGTYYPVTQARILDTRTIPKRTLGVGGTVVVQVTGVAGVPATGVSAVVLNLTGVSPTLPTWLTAYPTGGTVATVSSLNLAAGLTRANQVTVPLSADGRVTIRNQAGSVDVVADVLGYYAKDDSLQASQGMGHMFAVTVPERLLDSRDPEFGGAFGPAEVVDIGADFGAENPTVRALAVTATAVSPTARGWLTLWNGTDPQPPTSTLNFVAGQTVPNMATVPVRPDPSGVPLISVANRSSGLTHVLVDISGVYFEGTDGLRFRPLAPQRIVDTRSGLGGSSTLQANISTAFTAPAAVAGAGTWALVANTTAVKPTATTYLTVWEDDPSVARPTVSNVNATAGSTVANATVVPLSEVNAFRIYNQRGETNVLLDVAGSFEADPPAGAASAGGGPAPMEVSPVAPR